MSSKNIKESAAKLCLKDENKEGSETIPKGSTFISGEANSHSINGSATNPNVKVEGHEIVRNERFNRFLEHAKNKFGDKFDYSKVDYVKAKAKVKIICPVHGEFEQTPDKHLNSMYGCPKCAIESDERRIKNSISRIGKPNNACRLPITSLVERLKNKFGDKITFVKPIGEWNGFSTKSIFKCEKHGEFVSTPNNILLKNNTYGCQQCGVEYRTLHKRQSIQRVESELRKIWNNKFEYDFEGYINKSSRIKIICPEHGAFYKSVQKHMYQGCPKCKLDDLKKNGVLPGGYCYELFDELPELKTKSATLYYLVINDGEFYKIGITTKSVSDRIKGLKSKANAFGETINFKILREKEMTLFEAFQLEQKILEENKSSRVYTKPWSTEIFRKDISETIKLYFC